MFRRSLVASLAAAVVGACPLVCLAAEPAGKSEPIGRVTAAFGTGTADTAAGSRKIDLQSLINNDERITTGGGGMTVLLASRVVLKIDAQTAVSIFEGPSQTNIRVEHGTVHIFVGKRPGATGPVCAGDANGCVETGEGVFLISSNPDTKESYFASEHGSISLQPMAMTSAGKMDHSKHVVLLSADQQAIMKDGEIVSNGSLDRVAFNQNTKSLGRLEQAQMSQGAQTFRLRSRALDTESALTQLSAAGWINRTSLPASTGSTGSSQPGETKVGSSNNKGNASSGNASAKPTGGTRTASNSNASAVKPATPVQPAAQPVAVAPSVTPAESSAAPTPTASPVAVAPTAPPAAIAIETPVVEAPVVSAPAVPSTPSAALPAAADVGNTSAVAVLPEVADVGNKGKGNNKPDKLDKIDIGDVTDATGGASKAASITPAVAPPTVDLGLQTPIVQTPVAPIDLNLEAPKDHGKGLGKIDKIDKVAPPSIDLGIPKTGADTSAVTAVKPADVAPVVKVDAPKIDIAPPKIDIAPPVAIDVPKVEAPKVDVAPKIDPPKIDIATLVDVAPKVDVVPKIEAPKIDVAPKIDIPKIDIVPKVEVALPKIDLDIKPVDASVPPPTTPTVIAPPPTVPQVPTVAPVIPTVDLAPAPAIDTAPKTVTIPPAPTDIKVEINDVKTITDTVTKDITDATDPVKKK
jgi:hypothetical protein